VPDLKNLIALITLDLRSNALEGSVPASLINHPTLQSLYISNNFLEGLLPVGQSNSSLVVADFSYNRLTLTTVDLPSVKNLNLSSNKYTGKGELLNVKLNSAGAVVDLRGNPFKCSYPGMF
jgi:Leucine-rich repeat (LRR) protein